MTTEELLIAAIGGLVAAIIALWYEQKQDKKERAEEHALCRKEVQELWDYILLIYPDTCTIGDCPERKHSAAKVKRPQIIENRKGQRRANTAQAATWTGVEQRKNGDRRSPDNGGPQLEQPMASLFRSAHPE